MKVMAYDVRPDELPSFEKYAEALGHEVTVVEERFSPQNAHLAEGHEAIAILGNCVANEEAVSALAQLGVRYIVSRSAGIDNIAVKEARKLGIRVAHVPVYSPNAVAEFTVLASLCLARRLHLAVKRVARHNFSLDGLLGFELRNQTIGFIGTGRIGYAAIKAFAGFGARLIGHDIIENEKAKKLIDYKPLDALFSEADVISLHSPLTPDTHHLINHDALARMKDGVILINTARGGLVNTKDVIRGLEAGKIGGFATDVYEDEAGVFHYDHSQLGINDDVLERLLRHPRVLVTPHYAFYTDQAVANMVKYALENLTEFAKTGKCKNEIVTASH